MTLTPAALERISRRLYADPVYRGKPAWQSALARGLGVDARRVRRWVAGSDLDPALATFLAKAEAVAGELAMWDQPPATLIAERMRAIISSSKE